MTIDQLIDAPVHLAIVKSTVLVAGIAVVAVIVGLFLMLSKFYKKVDQGTALVRNGVGGTKVNFTGDFVIPIAHKAEFMDISVKRIEIARLGNDGLICKDNMRADIKVAFFVRVNATPDDVKRVAQAIGCERASNEEMMRTLFDAKFSEALKTVGKQFEFVELYDKRDRFRDEILKVIGTDLNGYSLEDCAIDHLEQTALESLNPDNILDAEGIKKINERTAEQAKLSNQIKNEKMRVIKQQDVEAKEAILELERQQAEAEAKQEREIASVQAREEAEAKQVEEENRLKAEQARIATQEEVEIAEQNKERQVLVAQRNKERTDAVEMERVERDRELEVIDRERVTQLKAIERDKALEVEKKEIQDVIKERVAVEKTVVEEQQKILDTEAFAGADREKQVKVTIAEAEAQEALVKQIKEAEAVKEAAQMKADQDLYETIKAAEAERQAAELEAEEKVITAEAEQSAAEKLSVAKKQLAEATAAEAAAQGLGEVQVLEARAAATEKQGTAEAKVSQLKFSAEAQGIEEKANAMKIFDEVGREHEEFKLELDKEKEIELAGIHVQKDVAAEQAKVLGEALKSANIDIVGGEATIFDRLINSIATGKQVDRLVDNSDALTDVKETFFNGNPDYFKSQLGGLIDQFGVSSDDLKNLSIAALLSRMLTETNDEGLKGKLQSLLGAAERYGLQDQPAGSIVNRLLN